MASVDKKARSAHHWLPNRAHLSHFAERDRIVTVDRITGARRGPSSPATIARERGLYAYIDDEGRVRGDFEDELGEIEGNANEVIKLIASPLVVMPRGDHRKALGLFIALLALRTPEVKKRDELMAKWMVEREIRSYLAVKRERIADFRAAGADVPEEEIRERERLAADNIRASVLDDPNRHVRGMVLYAEAVSKLMLERRWMVFQFPHPTLITSDHPVICVRTARERHFTSVTAGFENAESIFVPLTSSRLLVMNRRALSAVHGAFDERRVGGTALAAMTNRLLMDHSYMEYFVPPTLADELDIRPMGARTLAHVVDTSRYPDLDSLLNEVPRDPRPTRFPIPKSA